MTSMSATVEDQFRKAVNKPVTFKFPGNEGSKDGTLTERVIFRSPGSNGVPYWDVVDLIEFEDETEPWLRFGYYTKSGEAGRLTWASRNALTEPKSSWKKLLVHAAKEKGWFKELLVEVMAELQNETA